jgi:hypothetical protein
MIEDMRIDLRRRRAEVLAHEVIAEVERLTNRFDTPPKPADIFYAVLHVFELAGVEAITDRARAEAGLPPRDEKGWTLDELHAMEKARLDVMTKPLRMVKGFKAEVMPINRPASPAPRSD